MAHELPGKKCATGTNAEVIVLMPKPSGEHGEQTNAATKGVVVQATSKPAGTHVDSAYLRAENEDDDGYDPYSDRPAPSEPLFERDPWN